MSEIRCFGGRERLTAEAPEATREVHIDVSVVRTTFSDARLVIALTMDARDVSALRRVM